MAETKSWSEEAIVAEGLEPKDYEVVRGELVARAPVSFDGSRAATRLGVRLVAHVEAVGSGEVLDGIMRYLLSEEPRTERRPDWSFVARERVPPPGAANFPGAPDLAIEVLSPSDSTQALERKAQEYFAAGGREVWVVDPALRTITVLRPDRDPKAFSSGDGLASVVLPDLALPVADVFARP